MDWNDRRPAEPTADTLALMGTRAQESTVGILHFLTDSDTSFSGVLKQRYSDFVVHEVAPDGDVCKGTDFPGLLRPIEHVRPSATPAVSPSPLPATPQDPAIVAPAEEGSTDKILENGHEKGDENGNKVGSDMEGGASEEGGGGEDAHSTKKEKEKEKDEADAKRKEEEEMEEVKQHVHEGVQTLVPVLGEEVTATVQCFVLEGLLSKRRDKNTLTLPSGDKAARTQVYNLLKQHLSKYLLAVTVDDPASLSGPSVENPDGATTEATDGNTDKDSKDENMSVSGHDATAKDSATETSGAPAAATPPKPDPNGPKCVQLKMKPDWRRTSNKRRRGDLAEGVGGGGGRWAWPADLPEYCRFVLYKENSDTMGAVSRLCKHFRFSGKNVGYAGTKDKRGVTSQWCTVKRKKIEELRTFNRPLGAFQGAIVLLGNFSYVTEPLKLGDLSGNRFSIVLRNLALPKAETDSTSNGAGDSSAEGSAAVTGDAEEDKEALAAATAAAEEAAVVQMGANLEETINQRCAWVKERGFINYFGLQRFGSGGAPTSEVGLAMLKEDWEGAVRLIMTPRLGENEATHDSKVHYLKNPIDVQGTLNRLPFFMDAEKSMMQALIRGGPKAHVDALKAVPKNLQLMYLHAFQSLVWNLAASRRVEVYGRDGAVEGDLVFPKDSACEGNATLVEPEVTLDAGGSNGGVGDEEGGEEAADGREAKRPKSSRAPLPSVHVVTREDVDAGTFELTDVVLPMPGSGVTYPSNDVKECYTKALEERGLTEACYSSSSQKAFSLGGMYRRLIQVPHDMEWEVKRYEDHTLHLINTDIDDLLDVDDARIAAEHAEKKKRDEVAAAEAADAAAAVETGKPEPGADTAPADAMHVEDSSCPPPSGGAPSGADPQQLDRQGRSHALCLHFTLPAAAYATMCLREITRQDTSTSFQSSLNALAPGQHPPVAGKSSVKQGEHPASKAGGSSESGNEAADGSVPSKATVIKIGASLGRQ